MLADTPASSRRIACAPASRACWFVASRSTSLTSFDSACSDPSTPATSTRLRGHKNAWNLITIEPERSRVHIEVRMAKKGPFTTGAEADWIRRSGVWQGTSTPSLDSVKRRSPPPTQALEEGQRDASLPLLQRLGWRRGAPRIE